MTIGPILDHLQLHRIQNVSNFKTKFQYKFKNSFFIVSECSATELNDPYMNIDIPISFLSKALI